MRSYMNTVNSFEVNSLPVNAGTLRPGGLTSEHESSFWILGEDYSFNEEVSFYAGSVTGLNGSVNIEEDVSVSASDRVIWGPHNNLDTSSEFTLWADMKYGTSAGIEPEAEVNVHPVMKWRPQAGSISFEPVARFFSDMDNLFGSIFPFLNESTELDIPANMIRGSEQNVDQNVSLEPCANVICGPQQGIVDHKVSVAPQPNVIFGPSHDWQPDAEFDAQMLRVIWRNVDVENEVSVFCPMIRQIGSAVDIEEEVALWLRDWSDADEDVVSVDIKNYTGMLVDLWVKMYFYPINNTSGMDACVTIKRPIFVEKIENVAEVVSSAFIKKWVQYIGAEAENFFAPVVGVTADVGIGNTAIATMSGCLVMKNNGTVIANNANDGSEKDSVTVGGDVYVNGYLKLQLHTKDCPVYP